MPNNPRRLTALVVAALIAAIAAYWLLPARQTGDVGVPPREADPEQVVSAYLDALNAHDCDTAKALTTSHAKDSAEMWCEEVASLMDVDVHDHRMESPEYTGHSAPEEVANVGVRFDLNWRPFHNDSSLPEGSTTWGYLLVRDSADSPWRIFGEGKG